MSEINYSDHENATRILSDGWELFQQKGYLGVSIDEICQRCGITKPTLYYYFKSKENLFVEVLLHQLHGFSEVIEQPGPLRERLELIATVMLDSFKKDYSYLVRDLEHIKLPENATRVQVAFSSEIFIPIVHLLEGAVSSGQLRGDAQFLAQAYMGLVETFIARAAEHGLDNRQIAAKVVTVFLQGVQA